MKSLDQVITAALAAVSPGTEAREREWAEQERKQRAFELAQKRDAALSPLRSQLPTSVFAALVHGGRLEPTKPLRTVQRWLANPAAPVALVLSGGTGCGKTVAMAHALAACGGEWCSAAALARLAMAGFGDEAAEYQRALRSRFLLIDDVGAERGAPEHVAAALVEALEKRGAVRTLVSTNLSKDDFAKTYSDERLLSRIARVAWVDCAGPDLRLVKP